MPRFDKLLIWLSTLDEVALLELLDLNTEDIINRFKDVIMSRKDELDTEYEAFYSMADDETDIDDPHEGLSIDDPDDYDYPPWEGDDEYEEEPSDD